MVWRGMLGDGITAMIFVVTFQTHFPLLCKCTYCSIESHCPRPCVSLCVVVWSTKPLKLELRNSQYITHTLWSHATPKLHTNSLTPKEVILPWKRVKKGGILTRIYDWLDFTFEWPGHREVSLTHLYERSERTKCEFSPFAGVSWYSLVWRVCGPKFGVVTIRAEGGTMAQT